VNGENHEKKKGRYLPKNQFTTRKKNADPIRSVKQISQLRIPQANRANKGKTYYLNIFAIFLAAGRDL
jgi:hypothetical protein|tara:strand:+ start:99 stop:302 length:204 start_codon:yes stop_codon:yes gene_type:complete